MAWNVGDKAIISTPSDTNQSIYIEVTAVDEITFPTAPFDQGKHLVYCVESITFCDNFGSSKDKKQYYLYLKNEKGDYAYPLKKSDDKWVGTQSKVKISPSGRILYNPDVFTILDFVQELAGTDAIEANKQSKSNPHMERALEVDRKKRGKTKFHKENGKCIVEPKPKKGRTF